MKLKSTLIKPFARKIAAVVSKNSRQAVQDQGRIFKRIIKKAKATSFGLDHNFEHCINHQEFANQVPIRDYEQLRPYIDRVVAGEENILWPGRPKYFAKTSGTTSGSKFIPITKASLPNHFNSARNALFCQASRLNNFSFFSGKMIFLSGSPELSDTKGIPTGRLSGIVNHAVPSWLRANQLPTYNTNIIEDWDEKVERIIQETVGQNMTLISGIPPWVKDYFERLLQQTDKMNIGSLFPNLDFVVHGGVNFEPYRNAFDELIGRPYTTVETFPASEGFFAFQDQEEADGLLINSNSGIFFEFIKASEIHDENPERLTLEHVELGENYALIISSNAGLWAYSIGDTIEFVSLDPYRIRVTGRIKHFISAFGEHVIAQEVEHAIKKASEILKLNVSAFTVAPKIDSSDEGVSCHQWILELNGRNIEADRLAQILDESIRQQNSYYDDLRRGLMLIKPEVVLVKEGSFARFMRNQGKLGGQNKVAILSNDRNIADGILSL